MIKELNATLVANKKAIIQLESAMQQIVMELCDSTNYVDAKQSLDDWEYQLRIGADSSLLGNPIYQLLLANRTARRELGNQIHNIKQSIKSVSRLINPKL